MKKGTDKCTVILFVVFLSSVFLFNLFTHDKEFSPRENRYLQTLPSFSFSRLFSGEYTREAENYCADQFIGRDLWISLKARTELAQGKKENNGVFLCDGDRLLETFHAPELSDLYRRTDAVNILSENAAVPVTFALIPSAGEIESMLVSIGAKHCAEDIGVHREDIGRILRFSPLVRNRLTLMRMCRMIEL